MAGGRRVPWEMKMDESISKAASAMIPFGLPGFPKPSAAASAREGNDQIKQARIACARGSRRSAARLDE
jgi:hypothetical protein